MKRPQRSSVLITSSFLLLSMAATAQQTENPQRRTPTAPTGTPTPAPAQPEDQKRYQQTTPPTVTPTVTPVPAPVPVAVPTPAPTLVPAPAATPLPAPVTTPSQGLGQGVLLPGTTGISLLGPIQQQPVVPTNPLGNELRGKIKDEERHFTTKSAAAKSAFDARQLAERTNFEAASKNMGFWEARRQKKEFLATQDKQRREFSAEQEKQRRMYEWRYP